MPEHGSASTYVNHRCRCAPCKEAAKLAQQQTRRRRLSRPAPARVHGTYNGYTNYACRCDACKEAAAKRHERKKRMAQNKTTSLEELGKQLRAEAKDLREQADKLERAADNLAPRKKKGTRR